MEERAQRRGEPVQSAIILALADARAYYVTQELERFDRELRRTTASVRRGPLPLEDSLAESVADSERLRLFEARPAKPGRVEEVPDRPRELRQSLHGVRPDNPHQSSLRLVASEQGSSLLLLEAAGALITVMVSDPLTAIANAAAWSGPIRRVRAWFDRSNDPLDGVSARQALTVLSEFGGTPTQVLGAPDAVVDLDTGPSLHLPDGTIIQGRRRINVVHKYPDGSTTWYEIE